MKQHAQACDPRKGGNHLEKYGPLGAVVAAVAAGAAEYFGYSPQDPVYQAAMLVAVAGLGYVYRKYGF